MVRLLIRVNILSLRTTLSQPHYYLFHDTIYMQYLYHVLNEENNIKDLNNQEEVEQQEEEKGNATI